MPPCPPSPPPPSSPRPRAMRRCAASRSSTRTTVSSTTWAIPHRSICWPCRLTEHAAYTGALLPRCMRCWNSNCVVTSRSALGRRKNEGRVVAALARHCGLGRRHVLRVYGSTSGSGEIARSAAALASLVAGPDSFFHVGMVLRSACLAKRPVHGVFHRQLPLRASARSYHDGERTGHDVDLRPSVLLAVQAAAPLRCPQGLAEGRQGLESDSRFSGVEFAARPNHHHRGNRRGGPSIDWPLLSALSPAGQTTDFTRWASECASRSEEKASRQLLLSRLCCPSAPHEPAPTDGVALKSADVL